MNPGKYERLLTFLDLAYNMRQLFNPVPHRSHFLLTTSMSSFLSLPHEIRDQIINDVLYFHVTPPGYLSAPTVRQQIQQSQQDGAFPVLPAYKVYNAYALLLTNWQVHHETFERLKKVPRTCKVDIYFASEDSLLPTWVFVPCRRDKINTIEISFQTSGKEKPYLEALQLIFRQGSTNGAQPAPISALMLHILNVCITASPVMDRNNSNSIEYHVESLRICMCTPSNILEECQFITRSSEFDFDQKYVGRLPNLTWPTRLSRRTPEERVLWIRSNIGDIVRGSLSTHERLVQSWGLARSASIFVDGEQICYFSPTSKCFGEYRDLRKESHS
jgi:hypothetical protein